MQPNTDNLPAMVVQRLDGVVVQQRRRYVVDKELSTPEKKRYKMEDYETEIDAGYLVTFPRKGHAIRVDQEELERLKSRLADPNGYVESEKTDVDLTAVLRAAGGSSLVTVIQKGVTK